MEELLRKLGWWRPAVRCARATGLLALIRRQLRGRVAILCYHHLSVRADPPVWRLSPVIGAAEFARQMEYLRNRACVVSLDDAVEMLQGRRPVPPRAVVLTFDDGYASQYRLAFPVLRRLGLPATVYLTTAHVGTTRLFWWDELEYMLLRTPQTECRLDAGGRQRTWSLAGPAARDAACRAMAREVCKRLPLAARDRLLADLRAELGIDAARDEEFAVEYGALDQAMVAEMQAAGIRFGSHTARHPVLPNETPAAQEQEIRASLAALDPARPLHFCYPDGALDEVSVAAVRAAGFASAVSSRIGWAAPGDDLYRLCRLPADGEALEFTATVTGFKHALGRLAGAARGGGRAG